MLSKKEIICPESLLKIAKTKGPAKAVIVNAVKPVSIESAKQAVDANLLMNQMKTALLQSLQNLQVKVM